MADITIPDTIDPRRKARDLYWQGWRLVCIGEYLGINPKTIQTWKGRDQWDKTSPIDRCAAVTEARIIQLTNKENKEGKDFKELDLLWRMMERQARIERYRQGGNEADLNPNIENRNKAWKDGTRKKPTKNEFSPEQVARLHEAFMDWQKPHQRVWYNAGLIYKIRDILGSRQIGKTKFFAYEDLDDALQTGRNQIWLSASKAQAHVAKQYVIQFARDAADVELRGDPIIIPRHCAVKDNGEDPTLYYLGTNAFTAQSYHGNFKFDEYFWVHKFKKLQSVASAMATHKVWRQTYLSTPSSMTHEAYAFWSGRHFNEGRSKKEHLKLDISHEALKAGRLCEDYQWRQIVTVEDAVEGGFDFIDLEFLRKTKSPADFANKYLCQFIDDSASAFPFSLVFGCMVDSWEVWEDYKPLALRPLGNREVWVGYDPADTGDSAGLVVVAPPMVPGGKFRVLEKLQLWGLDYEAQNQAIKEVAGRYQVGYIGIDATGLGSSVLQLVKAWFPRVTSISYSVETKTHMVLKTYQAMAKGRLEFDAGWSDLMESFLAIKKTLTNSGRQSTYTAGRSEDISHAELAWAVMHCLINEPLGAEETGGRRNIVESF